MLEYIQKRFVDVVEMRSSFWCVFPAAEHQLVHLHKRDKAQNEATLSELLFLIIGVNNEGEQSRDENEPVMVSDQERGDDNPGRSSLEPSYSRGRRTVPAPVRRLPTRAHRTTTHRRELYTFRNATPRGLST